MPKVQSVSGLGMMIGIEVAGKTAKEVVQSGIEHGVIALRAKSKVRLLPAADDFPDGDRPGAFGAGTGRFNLKLQRVRPGGSK